MKSSFLSPYLHTGPERATWQDNSTSRVASASVRMWGTDYCDFLKQDALCFTAEGTAVFWHADGKQRLGAVRSGSSALPTIGRLNLLDSTRSPGISNPRPSSLIHPHTRGSWCQPKCIITVNKSRRLHRTNYRMPCEKDAPAVSLPFVVIYPVGRGRARCTRYRAVFHPFLMTCFLFVWTGCTAHSQCSNEGTLIANSLGVSLCLNTKLISCKRVWGFEK